MEEIVLTPNTPVGPQKLVVMTVPLRAGERVRRITSEGDTATEFYVVAMRIGNAHFDAVSGRPVNALDLPALYPKGFFTEETEVHLELTNRSERVLMPKLILQAETAADDDEIQAMARLSAIPELRVETKSYLVEREPAELSVMFAIKLHASCRAEVKVPEAAFEHIIGLEWKNVRVDTNPYEDTPSHFDVKLLSEDDWSFSITPSPHKPNDPKRKTVDVYFLKIWTLPAVSPELADLPVEVHNARAELVLREEPSTLEEAEAEGK